ncbi:MAG TPA: hypothetical protein GX693_02695 [Firmicutes bacterium]|nr:hypothetical protein [Bacillota bacterium]
MDTSAIALQVVVLGLGVTLTALFLLYLLLNIFGRLFFQQKKNSVKLEPPAAVTTPAVSVKTSPSDLNSRLVAAIVGSVSTIIFDKQPKQPFKISIAPSSSSDTCLTSKAWVLAGRKELMTGALKLATLRRRRSHAEI